MHHFLKNVSGNKTALSHSSNDTWVVHMLVETRNHLTLYLFKREFPKMGQVVSSSSPPFNLWLKSAKLNLNFFLSTDI